jgi:hypothetical protein
MNWFKKSLATLLATVTLFGTGITTPIIAEDTNNGGTPATTATPVTEQSAKATDNSWKDETEHYTVTVTADEGALPQGATFTAEELKENSNEYKNAKIAIEDSKKLDETDFVNDYSMSALDVHFALNGKEIEPDTTNNKKVSVLVEINSISGILGNDTNKETLEINHIDETSGKAVASVVADSNKGNIKNSDNTAIATFDMKSFSVIATVGKKSKTVSNTATANALAANNATTENAVTVQGKSADQNYDVKSLSHTKTMTDNEDGTYTLSLISPEAWLIILGLAQKRML